MQSNPKSDTVTKTGIFTNTTEPTVKQNLLVRSAKNAQVTTHYVFHSALFSSKKMYFK